MKTLKALKHEKGLTSHPLGTIVLSGVVPSACFHIFFLYFWLFQMVFIIPSQLEAEVKFVV